MFIPSAVPPPLLTPLLFDPLLCCSEGSPLEPEDEEVLPPFVKEGEDEDEAVAAMMKI